MSKTGQIKTAVGGVIFKGDQVLLIKRSKAPYKGHWSIPGGKVEHGESLKDALHREIMEETGVRIKITSLINVFESLPKEASDTHYIMVDYVGEWVSGAPNADDDAEEAAFFPFKDALDHLAWDQTRTALHQAKNAITRTKHI